MLKKSFIHIQGIGEKGEREIWNNGISSWEELIGSGITLFSARNRERIKRELDESIENFSNGNLSFFASRLPRSHHWRVYPLVKKPCFLDIETTGLSKSNDIITVIGLYDGSNCKIFINGKNMNEFENEIKKYDMIITYNGSCFDLPFIKNKNPDVKIPDFHVDLRYLLKRLGYSGGLKKIERQMNINRNDDIKDIDGFEAVRLWKAYQKGDNAALNKLIDYNIADIKNLKPIMDFAYDKISKEIFDF